MIRGSIGRGRPAPTASPTGRCPTLIVFTMFAVFGWIRQTMPASLLATQIPWVVPDPARRLDAYLHLVAPARFHQLPKTLGRRGRERARKGPAASRDVSTARRT